jgi:hypothetical protein
LLAQVNKPTSAFWYQTDILQYGNQNALPGSAIQFASNLIVSQHCPDDRWFLLGNCPAPFSDVYQYLVNTSSGSVMTPTVSTTVPPPPPPSGVPVAVTRLAVKFNMDASTVLSSPAKEANFSSTLSQQIATALSTSASRIQINSLSVGSLVVDFTILPDLSGQSLATPVDLADAFVFQFNNSQSLLRSQPLMSSVDTSFAPQVSDVTLLSCPDGSIQSVCPAPSSPSPDSSSIIATHFLTIIIAIAVGVTVVACLIGGWCCWKRAKDQAMAAASVASITPSAAPPSRTVELYVVKS